MTTRIDPKLLLNHSQQVQERIYETDSQDRFAYANAELRKSIPVSSIVPELSVDLKRRMEANQKALREKLLLNRALNRGKANRLGVTR